MYSPLSSFHMKNYTSLLLFEAKQVVLQDAAIFFLFLHDRGETRYLEGDKC